MQYIITVKQKDSGSELWRNYEWEVDSDFTAKGEAIEDMMETLENSQDAWSQVEPEHQKMPKQCPECGEMRHNDHRVESGMKCGICAYGAEARLEDNE